MNHTDKISHFLAGFMVATVFQFSLLAMIISLVIAAAGKEIYDLVNNNAFDWKDLLCTLIGGFAAYWIMTIYKIYFLSL